MCIYLVEIFLYCVVENLLVFIIIIKNQKGVKLQGLIKNFTNYFSSSFLDISCLLPVCAFCFFSSILRVFHSKPTSTIFISSADRRHHHFFFFLLPVGRAAKVSAAVDVGRTELTGATSFRRLQGSTPVTS